MGMVGRLVGPADGPREVGGWNLPVCAGRKPPDPNRQIPAPNLPAKRPDRRDQSLAPIRPLRHVLSLINRRGPIFPSRRSFAQKGLLAGLSCNRPAHHFRPGQPRANRVVEISGPSNSRRQPGASTTRKFQRPRQRSRAQRSWRTVALPKHHRPLPPPFGVSKGGHPLWPPEALFVFLYFITTRHSKGNVT